VATELKYNAECDTLRVSWWEIELDDCREAYEVERQLDIEDFSVLLHKDCNMALQLLMPFDGEEE
jgi:hypothetical protein